MEGVRMVGVQSGVGVFASVARPCRRQSPVLRPKAGVAWSTAGADGLHHLAQADTSLNSRQGVAPDQRPAAIQGVRMPGQPMVSHRDQT